MLTKINPKAWEGIKWASNGLYVIATVMMTSSQVAGYSVWPWIVYLIANSVWLLDSIKLKNTPYIYLAVFFCSWDLLLIISRVAKIEVLHYMMPIVQFLETLI